VALRYLFDEHLRGTLPLVVVRAARHYGLDIDVLQVGDPDGPALGTADADLLEWAESDNRMIVSLDSRTLPRHLDDHLAAGRHCPGVLIVRTPMNIALAEWLVLIAFVTEPEEWRDRVSFVP
jgi:hypothetical protein